MGEFFSLYPMRRLVLTYFSPVAMPQLMRPKLHVLGVVTDVPTASDAVESPAESPAVTVAVGTPLVAAADPVRYVTLMSARKVC